ncbi:fusaric acid resistance family protein [Roseiarcus fermentans]|uniref:Fusaric acid resistance family protein n=1 Tax=Roseiarcus fermentans TaxID=1473586 RepID=A0A366FBB6_9HYPH|nr:FUSC family protein [Roseiarcus fermentans]RBP11897.1 fusaric acid resistance family protein [Roseiarcus fermentans]
MGAFASLARKLAALAPQLRYSLRVSVAGVVAFAIARSLDLPFHGLWAVLTAIVVSQVSVGGSLRASIEYNIGTLGGAVWAAAVGLAFPHVTPVAQAIVLVVSVAPMAMAAAVSPSFRVAPFSAVLVLLIGGQLGETPLVSAVTRILEVAIGGAVAVAVSLAVFPERARRQGLKAASGILNQMADLLPKLLVRVSRDGDAVQIALAQNRLGDAVSVFRGLAEDARRERMVSLGPHPDPAALARALLRTRHDFVMIARATGARFPEPIASRLAPPLTRFADEATAYLRNCAAALASRTPAPSIAPIEAAHAAYAAQVAAVRREGLSIALQTADVERVFALGFGLEQLCRDLVDLEPRIEDLVGRGAARP